MAIADQMTQLNTLRQQMAANLTTMGVEAASTEGLSLLIPKILDIPSGGRITVEEFTLGSYGKTFTISDDTELIVFYGNHRRYPGIGIWRKGVGVEVSPVSSCDFGFSVSGNKVTITYYDGSATGRLYFVTW